MEHGCKGEEATNIRGQTDVSTRGTGAGMPTSQSCTKARSKQDPLRISPNRGAPSDPRMRRPTHHVVGPSSIAKDRERAIICRLNGSMSAGLAEGGCRAYCSSGRAWPLPEMRCSDPNTCSCLDYGNTYGRNPQWSLTGGWAGRDPTLSCRWLQAADFYR